MNADDKPVQSLLIEEEMKDSYLTYAMSVIVARALPDVRDGMKPSQRRIIVSMNDLGLGPRSKQRKCAKIVGEVMGNYHPHGDQAIYPTLVRMGQWFASRYLLVDPQGNFGSIDGDPPAAYRYTEARMSVFAALMLEDLGMGTVDYVPNFDEQLMEPTVLPSKFPNLLCNGSAGIAVGMATSIPPHNLSEVCDAIIHLVDHPEATAEELLQFVKGPDFPTGAMVFGYQGIRDAYTTGRGILTVRARMGIEERKGGRKDLVVTEIPYNQNKARIIEKIAELVKDDRIQGISDIRDESDKDGLRVVIELKKDADEQVIENQLYQLTPLQDSFSMIMIALVKGRPQLLSLRDLCVHYKDHRFLVITRRTRFLLDKAEKEAHILEGLLVALANIDAVIELIKKSENVPAARRGLMERFSLSEIQADSILRMQLQKLTHLETEKLQAELAELRKKIAEYMEILAKPELVYDIIREDLYEMKEKHTDKRRTEIVANEVESLTREDLILEEDMAVLLTHAGYIKRLPLTAYRKQARGGKGVSGAERKEGDFAEHLFIASTHDYLLFFTSRGQVHWQKVYDVQEMSRTAKGRSIANLLNLAEGEKITSAFPVKHFDKRYLFMATRKGVVKKTLLEAFGKPKRGGIRAITLDEGDSLIGTCVTTGRDEIMLGTRNGHSIRFPEGQVRPMGRSAGGVTGIKLRAGDEVVDMVIVNPSTTVLTVCERGYGKRTSFDEYRIQSRGGYGIINIKTTERNGKVVALRAVSDSDEIIIVTSQAMTVRSPVSDISTIGRATQGVRLMNVEGKDEVGAVARIAAQLERDAETPQVEQVEATGEVPPANGADSADEEPPADEGEKE